MTYCEIMNQLNAARREVTRERLGFNVDGYCLSPEALEKDLKEAARRLENQQRGTER